MRSTLSALTIDHVAIDELRPDPANPRHIPQAELEALTRSIEEFGLIDPIIARREGKTVIGGHQRLPAARKPGLKSVPAVFLHISPEEARRLGGLRRRKERTVAGAYEFQGLATVADIRRLLEMTASPIGTPTRPRSSPPTVAGLPAKTKHHQTEGR
jgi:hypothetical protein